MVRSSSDAPDFSSEAFQFFRTICSKVCCVQTATVMWKRLPERDRQRLGGEFGIALERHGEAAAMWQELRGVSRRRAVLDVAEFVRHIDARTYEWLLRESGEVSDDPEEILEMAISAGHLVLTDKPRAAYWSGKVIDIDWEDYNSRWVYFWTLARSAKAGVHIDRLDFGDRRHLNYLANLKSRLTNMKGFPWDLGDKIVTAGRGSQTLNLAREMIRIIEGHTIEIAREYIG